MYSFLRQRQHEKIGAVSNIIVGNEIRQSGFWRIQKKQEKKTPSLSRAACTVQ